MKKKKKKKLSAKARFIDSDLRYIQIKEKK